MYRCVNGPTDVSQFWQLATRGTLVIDSITIDGGYAMGFRDMDLDDQVRAAIRRDTHLSSLRIGVNVRNGIVYLTGAVSARARQQAIKLVRGVESVAAVVDQLSVT